MTSSPGRGLLHLAAAVDQEAAHDTDACIEAVRLAERGGLDFVTLGDPFARPGPDAPAVLTRAAAATDRIGLVPAVTGAASLDAGAALAALELAGRGRVGRRIDIPPAEGEAPHGSAPHGSAPNGSAPNGSAPNGSAPNGSAPNGSTPDGEAPHGVPHPPHGHPVLVADATEAPARRAAARYADVVLVRAASAAQAAAVRDQLRRTAEEFGRDPDGLRVLASLLVDLGDGEYAAVPGHGGGGPRPTAQGPRYRGGPVDLAELIATWHASGVVDGFHLTPTEPRRDLERLVNGTVALLQHRGLFRTFYPGSTLREHLGLTGGSSRSTGVPVAGSHGSFNG